MGRGLRHLDWVFRPSHPREEKSRGEGTLGGCRALWPQRSEVEGRGGVSYLVSNSMRLVSTGTPVSGAAAGGEG